MYKKGVRMKRRIFFYFDNYFDRMSTSTIIHCLLHPYTVNVVQINLNQGQVTEHLLEPLNLVFNLYFQYFRCSKVFSLISLMPRECVVWLSFLGVWPRFSHRKIWLFQAPNFYTCDG